MNSEQTVLKISSTCLLRALHIRILATCSYSYISYEWFQNTSSLIQKTTHSTCKTFQKNDSIILIIFFWLTIKTYLPWSVLGIHKKSTCCYTHSHLKCLYASLAEANCPSAFIFSPNQNTIFKTKIKQEEKSETKKIHFFLKFYQQLPRVGHGRHPSKNVTATLTARLMLFKWGLFFAFHF